MAEVFSRIRPAAVAGTFYPDDPETLRKLVRAFMAEVPPLAGRPPKAAIVPHAGYVYSGSVAAHAYGALAAGRGVIRRVVLIGPTHRAAVAGFALSSADAFETPLGPVAVDREATIRLAARPDAAEMDLAHAEEHCLEVHLPFLREALGEVAIVPVLAGQVNADQVADLLDSEWGGPETAIVVSSDLSHYMAYEDCVTLDAVTAHAIEALQPEALGRNQACGRLPIAGLLLRARARGMSVATLDVRNSGDTAGPRGRVVGYGAWVFRETDPSARPVTERYGRELLELAEKAIRHGLVSQSLMPLDFATLPADLARPGAAFVTLNRQGRLRGCIGSLEPHRPLARDVADNAFAAAFRDPRFPPLSPEEMEGLDISVSVLGPMEPLHFSGDAVLLSLLEPGRDGLVIADRGRRALFLPQVWVQLPDPQTFLAQLKRKAGLPLAESPTMRAWRFRVDAVGRE